MLAPPGELAPPPLENPGSATVYNEQTNGVQHKSMVNLTLNAEGYTS